MSRTEQLEQVAITIESMVRDYGRRKDISITYCELVDGDVMENFTEWERKYHNILFGDEMFFVWEPLKDGEPFERHLLYTKCITGDSILTAAGELMDLVSHKF